MSDEDVIGKPPMFPDADQTVEAIHRGEVDAVVVLDGSPSPQVILLQGAEQPYRVLVDHMSEGALTIDPDGDILFANGRIAELTGYAPEHFVHRRIGALFEGEAHSFAPGASFEANLARHDAAPLPVVVRTHPVPVRDSVATLVTIADLSVRRRAEQLAAAERFARSVLEQATEAIVVLSPDGRIAQASGLAQDLAAQPPIGCTFSEAFPLESEITDKAEPQSPLPAHVLDGLLAIKPFHGLEVRLRGGRHAERAFLLSAGPLVDDANAPVGSIVTLTDITERKRAEEQRTMLVAELNHRVKNILAVVQSVAAQTARSARSLSEFNDAFAGRLKAIATAHDILSEARWTGVDLKEILAATLAPYYAGDQARLTMEGRRITLPAEAAVPLAMVFSELATNAVKYGALSVADGHIDVRWRLTDEDRALELAWSERNGPKVGGPQARGFGTRLVDRVVAHDLDGTARFDFDPGGVRCVVTFPVQRPGGSVGGGRAVV